MTTIREQLAAIIRDAVDVDHPDQGHFLRAADRVATFMEKAPRRSEAEKRLYDIAVMSNRGLIEGLTPEAVEVIGRADIEAPCSLCGVNLTAADTAPCEPDHGVCPIHDWQAGAEGAFAGLTEHCSSCGSER